MIIKPIRNDADLTNTFIRLESIFQADKGYTLSQGKKVEILITLIETYEEDYYPIKVLKSSDKLKIKYLRLLSLTNISSVKN